MCDWTSFASVVPVSMKWVCSQVLHEEMFSTKTESANSLAILNNIQNERRYTHTTLLSNHHLQGIAYEREQSQLIIHDGKISPSLPFWKAGSFTLSSRSFGARRNECKATLLFGASLKPYRASDCNISSKYSPPDTSNICSPALRSGISRCSPQYCIKSYALYSLNFHSHPFFGESMPFNSVEFSQLHGEKGGS